MLRELSFRKRLILGFNIILVLFSLVIYLSFLKIRDAGNISQQLYDHPFTVSVSVRDINIMVYEMYYHHMKDVVDASNKEAVLGAVKIVRKQDSLITEKYLLVKRQFLGEKIKVARAIKCYTEWKGTRDRIISLSIGGNYKEAIEMRKKEGYPRFLKTIAASADITGFAGNKAKEFFKKSIEAEKQASAFLLVLFLILIIVSFVIAFVITGSISKPVRVFTIRIKNMISGSNVSMPDKINEEQLLETTANELHDAYQKIRAFNRELEQKVEERTFELKSQNEEYLALNEEYLALNEQLKYKNDEYSSLNEELKETNEEMQSINEEYKSLNDELTNNSEILRKTNKELDIAMKKAAESELLKSAFLANMSHEIRTPMNAIKGFADLLCKPDLTSEKRQRFTKIITERSSDLLALINDILDISIIEAGLLKFHETNEDLIKLLTELNDFFIQKNSYVDNKKIEFRLKLDMEESRRFVTTDFTRLRQVLVNLIGNSIKFTSSGYIETNCTMIDDSILKFSVKDTGIGIPPDKKEIIFDRFRQAESNHTVKQFGGVGLGLSISKGIIESLGGRIWLESELDKGSVFYFTVPVKTEKPVAGKKITGDFSYNWKGKTILLVEDNVHNAEYIHEIIAETGASCSIAVSGKLALEMLGKGSYHIVLLDIRLPDLSGYDVLKKIKQIYPDIPVIAQTAYAGETDKEDCLNRGFSNYISKPVYRNDLLTMVSRYL